MAYCGLFEVRIGRITLLVLLSAKFEQLNRRNFITFYLVITVIFRRLLIIAMLLLIVLYLCYFITVLFGRLIFVL